MSKLIDLTGQVFGRWTVSTRAILKPHKTHWNCICQCGNSSIVDGVSLKSGDSTSCGCLRKETSSRVNTKHGHNRSSGTSRTYRCWQNMLKRCRDDSLHNYAGRGITVDIRWEKFENFLEDMGECPSEKFSIDREDNNKGYSPANCRWATAIQQANNRRSNRLLTLDNRTQTAAQWAREYNIPYATLIARLNNYGWSLPQALLLQAR